VLLENRASMSPEEIDFLIQRENGDLAHYQGFPVSDLVCVDEIQDQIDSELQKKLSMRNVIGLTIGQCMEDVEHSTGAERTKKISKIVLLVGIVGVSCSILAVGTYGCFKPFDLQNPDELESSDPKKVDDAVANYANAGHGLEYVAVIGIIGFRALQSMMGDQYKKVISQQIQETYRPFIEDGAQSRDGSDLLYRRMNQALSEYR
jgi:hypothetical protein